MSKKLKMWQIGDKFIAKKTANGYTVGETYTVNGVNGTNLCGSNSLGHNVGQWITTTQVGELTSTRQSLLEEKDALKKELEEVEAKLAYLSDACLTEYDDKEYRIYQALTILDTTTNKFESAKKLAQLMRELY